MRRFDADEACMHSDEFFADDEMGLCYSFGHTKAQLYKTARHLGKYVGTDWADEHADEYEEFAETIEESYNGGCLTDYEYNELAGIALHDFEPKVDLAALAEQIIDEDMGPQEQVRFLKEEYSMNRRNYTTFEKFAMEVHKAVYNRMLD